MGGEIMRNRLTTFILIGMILGIIVGYLCNITLPDPQTDKAIAGYIGLITDLFLRLIKMIIAPLVFSTLVAGIAHMGDIAALGRVGVRSILWFVLASLVSLALGLLLVTLLHPGVGLNLPIPPATAASGVETAAFNLKDFVNHIVPQSIFEAMSTNEILPIVVFSMFFGVALTAVGERGKPIVRGVEALVQVMLQVTNYVMRFAPFAVFTAVVPVEAKVAAILRATWPDLPRPLTMSLPLHPQISSTAFSKGSPKSSASASSARASSWRIARPNSSTPIGELRSAAMRDP